jgi:cytochrome c5
MSAENEHRTVGCLAGVDRVARARRAARVAWLGGLAVIAVASLGVLGGCSNDGEPKTPYLGASHVPDSRWGWEKLQTAVDPDAPLDEAMGGRTGRGTAVNKRLPVCFPAETRNVFYKVDQVFDVPASGLHPFDYTDGKAVTSAGRDAIRGQNTWMMWGEGNEAFWGWLQEKGYGLVDFLVLLDSRQRDNRFKNGGMINQPGMKSSTTRMAELGLYLDQADGEAIKLTQPSTDIDPATGKLEAPPAGPPGNNEKCSRCHADPKLRTLFEVGDKDLYAQVIAHLATDGVDPGVYGYPSGVVGLRLFPNPDFFGASPAAATARDYWKTKVTSRTDDIYYKTDSGMQKDPNLVRPFRVSMSCAFCHLGPHPLNPPADPEHPAWENLSSTIGNQYWSPQPMFANLTNDKSILYHFLRSQQPGTIDTSLVSTDHINNANTITAVFDVDARLTRASENQPEQQSAANLLSPIAQLPYPLAVEHGQKDDPRHTPRVLLDGADSIGAFGALSRVYLNIGTFPEEWARTNNTVIGFVPQRPFPLATLQSNSVYWQTSEQFRIPYLAAFFTYTSEKSQLSIVAPMKLASAPGGQEVLKADSAPAEEGKQSPAEQSKQSPAGQGKKSLAEQGKQVFLDNCTICHSSKQPAGFALAFSPKWREAKVPGEKDPAGFTLPVSFVDWEEFRHGAAFAEYRKRLNHLAAVSLEKTGQDFLDHNFLSTDVRIPITLVGTNSGRSVGTNGMKGQVWDNFSSDTYKSLPAVGAVRFYNPFSKRVVDDWGNNDEYYPPAGGPGYYRPASLISLWATAPYLHNNSLGQYPTDGSGTPDPSVAGRLRAFEDGINKLFMPLDPDTHGRVSSHNYGDLRGTDLDAVIGHDPGFIYRLPVEAAITFPAAFNHELLEGILGGWTGWVTEYVWIVLAILALVLVFIAHPRHAAFLLLLVFLGATGVIVLTRFDRLWWWLWLIPAVSLGLALYFWLASPGRIWSRVTFLLFALGFAVTGYELKQFADGTLKWDGELVGVNVTHIPRGTPLNLLMNINPEAPLPNLVRAVAGVTRGVVLSQRARAADSVHTTDARVLDIFQQEAGQALLEASKCPDFVLDRGHWFAKDLEPQEKEALKAFLKTL